MSRVSLSEFQQIKSGNLTYIELINKFECLTLEEKIQSLESIKNKKLIIEEDEFIDEILFKELNDQLYLHMIKERESKSLKYNNGSI